MSFLSNIWTDLRDKRLWPVAAILLIALVAIPVLLGGGGSTPPAADLATAPASPVVATPASVVKVADAAETGKVQRGGKLHDPFVQQHQAKAADAVKQALSSAGSAVSGGPASDTTSSSGGTTTTTPATTPAPSKPVAVVYDVNLRFGQAGVGKAYNNVARLTPLPSADNPFFVFMGVSNDGKSAVFMISNDAVASGDGTCTPSAEACETVTLTPGDTEFFDLQDGTAGVVEYQLDLKSIKKATARTTAKAAQAHARESSAGRDYLRGVIAADPAALSSWQWSEKLGLLVPKAAKAVGDAAHLPGAGAAGTAGATTLSAGSAG